MAREDRASASAPSPTTGQGGKHQGCSEAIHASTDPSSPPGLLNKGPQGSRLTSATPPSSPFAMGRLQPRTVEGMTLACVNSRNHEESIETKSSGVHSTANGEAPIERHQLREAIPTEETGQQRNCDPGYRERTSEAHHAGYPGHPPTRAPQRLIGIPSGVATSLARTGRFHERSDTSSPGSNGRFFFFFVTFGPSSAAQAANRQVDRQAIERRRRKVFMSGGADGNIAPGKKTPLSCRRFRRQRCRPAGSGCQE